MGESALETKADREWMELMIAAKQLGLSKEEVKNFLKNACPGAHNEKVGGTGEE